MKFEETFRHGNWKRKQLWGEPRAALIEIGGPLRDVVIEKRETRMA
jgi:hypothetical protein